MSTKQFHLFGGPRDGEVIESNAPIGQTIHYPGWESSGGQYVISHRSWWRTSKDRALTEMYLAYDWRADDE